MFFSPNNCDCKTERVVNEFNWKIDGNSRAECGTYLYDSVEKWKDHYKVCRCKQVLECASIEWWRPYVRNAPSFFPPNFRTSDLKEDVVKLFGRFLFFFLGKTKIKDKWRLKKKRERKCLFARQGAISEARLDASRKAFVLSSARAQSLSGVLLGMATTGSAAQSNSVRSFCLSFFLSFFLSLGLSLHVTSLSVRGESRVQYFFFLSRNPFWKENNAV